VFVLLKCVLFPRRDVKKREEREMCLFSFRSKFFSSKQLFLCLFVKKTKNDEMKRYFCTLEFQLLFLLCSIFGQKMEGRTLLIKTKEPPREKRFNLTKIKWDS